MDRHYSNRGLRNNDGIRIALAALCLLVAARGMVAAQDRASPAAVDRVRRVAAEIVAEQLNRLRENRLADSPLFHDLSEAAQQLAGYLARQAGDGDVPVGTDEALRRSREDLLTLLVERRRVQLRLRQARVGEMFQQLDQIRTATAAETAALENLAGDELAAAWQRVSAGVQDLLTLSDQWQLALRDAVPWGGELGESSRRALELLEAEGYRAALQGVHDAVAETDYDQALAAQQSLAARFEQLAEAMQFSAAGAGSQDATGAADAAVDENQPLASAAGDRHADSRLDRLRKLDAAMAGMSEQQAKVAQLAADRPREARQLEAAIAQQLRQAWNEDDFSDLLNARLDDVQRQVDAAVQTLGDETPAAAEARRRAAEAAERVILEAEAEVRGQLLDANAMAARMAAARTGANQQAKAVTDIPAASEAAEPNTAMQSGSAGSRQGDARVRRVDFDALPWFTRLPKHQQQQLRGQTAPPPLHGYADRLYRYFQQNTPGPR